MDSSSVQRRRQSVTDVLKEIVESECYFRGLNSHEQVLKLLQNEDDGTFLVRDKLTAQHSGMMALSVKFLLPGEKSDVWHFNIASEGGMVHLSHDPMHRFASFSELVRHFKRHPVSVGSSLSKIYLRRHLICRPALPASAATGRAPVPLPRTAVMPLKSQELSSQQAAIVLQSHMSRIHSAVAGHKMRQNREPRHLQHGGRGDANATIVKKHNHLDLLHLDNGDYIASLLGISGEVMGGGGIEASGVSIDRGAERCDCGVSFEDARLPSGWTMHISHEPESRGRLFFKDSSGLVTWRLPADVLEQMTEIEARKFHRHMAAMAPASAGVK